MVGFAQPNPRAGRQHSAQIAGFLANLAENSGIGWSI